MFTPAKSPGSLVFALEHSGVLRVARCFQVRAGSFSATSCRLVHSGSLVFNRVRIGVAGFIRVRLCFLRAYRGRQVHSGSLGFTKSA